MSKRLTRAALGICAALLAGCQAPNPLPEDPSSAAATVAATHDHLSSAPEVLDSATVSRLLGLALDCVHKEYPNVLLHSLSSAADAKVPRELHPAFFGCYDWHSSVHGHWLLARLAHKYPDAAAAPAAREALFTSLTSANLSAELNYLRGAQRQAFERPYGLAWLLQLDTELGDWAQAGDPLADSLQHNLAPLVQQALSHLSQWLPKLSHPVRSGTHAQTAFALGLMRDWASAAGATTLLQFIDGEVKRLYLADRDCPLNYEPSGHDFLSACLAEADLLRRVLPPARFDQWLAEFLPTLDSATAAWLPVASVTDPTDGHLAHLDGLNLSRAWMLEGIAANLSPGDERLLTLLPAAAEHRRAGMASIENPHYAGGHWLGSFATYLVTQRGLSQ